MARASEGLDFQSHHPENLKKQAKDLVKAHRSGEALACRKLQKHLPRLSVLVVVEVLSESVTLQEAQHVVARSYGLKSWVELIQEVRGSSDVQSSEALPISHYKELVASFKPF